MNRIPQKYRDLAARAGWTALQAVLGVVTVEALDLPAAYIPLVATLLSAVKTAVAGKVRESRAQKAA